MKEQTVTIADIQRASERIKSYVVRTPLLESELLNEQLNGRVLFKPECLQRTGSFKIRGALNKLSSLTSEQRQRGVIAYSSGNHAQGVATAAKIFNISAKIVMPSDAPTLKIANTRAYGAATILYDRYNEDRVQIAEDIAKEEGLTVIRPYDDVSIIAGQGVVGLEIVEQVAALEVQPDAILCPCGGGGLISGLATAVKASLPKVQVYAVEPAGFEDTQRSLIAGERLSNAPEARSICDAIVTECPGQITFAINRVLLSGGLVVSEADVIRALAEAFIRLKLVVEPGGVVGLAALLAGHYDLKGKTAVVVLSGGNIDLQSFIDFQNQARERYQ